MSLERRVAELMGYEYCYFYPSARAALAAYIDTYGKIAIPSNACPVLLRFADDVVPVNPETGLAPNVGVHLYGYREDTNFYPLELDPLMTGALREPSADASIISFGRHKTIELGAGGALLTNDSQLCLPHWYGLPPIVEEQLGRELDGLWDHIRAKWMLANYWDQHLGDSLIRIPGEQVIPWRVMRRVPGGRRDLVVRALREAGHHAGTNYPPLPGVTDPGAIAWGNEVINLWGASTDVRKACDIIKRTMGECAVEIERRETERRRRLIEDGIFIHD